MDCLNPIFSLIDERDKKICYMMAFIKCWIFAMKLSEFLSSLSKDEKKRFAEDCSCSLGHLYNIVSGQRRCGASLAVRIEKRTYGKVTKEEAAPHVEW
jgi:hypothetical protein